MYIVVASAVRTSHRNSVLYIRTGGTPGNSPGFQGLALRNETKAKWRQLAAARRQLVRANRAIESAERRCHFWCDAKTLQWQLKVITRAINAATAAAAAKTQRQQRAGLGWQQPKMAKPEAAKRKNRRDARKAKTEKKTRKKRETRETNTKNARNLFVINWLAINQTITKMLSTLRHVNTNTSTNASM